MSKIFISEELRAVLEKISQNSSIAKILLKGDVNSEILHEDYFNYLSIDNEATDGRLTFLDKTRFDLIVKSGDNLWESSKRYSTKPGALINKIFNSVSPKEVENFASLIKAALTKNTFKFSIVEGDEIKKWYLYDSYQSLDRGTLGASCLRHPHSQPLLEFYIHNKNKIKLLIMTDKNNRLVGRTLLWDIEPKKVMDRIYTINTDDEFYFKKWADENGYIYKHKQNWNATYLFESKGEVEKIKMEIKVDRFDFKLMPYLDTFKWFDFKKGVFFNYKPSDLDNVRTFMTTNGGSYPANHLELDQLDDHYWTQEEIVRLDYINLNTRNTNCVWSDICEKYILSKDSLYDEELGDYMFSKEYDFLNPADRISKIRDQKRKYLEERKLAFSKQKLDKISNFSNIVMEYYRDGNININDLTEVLSEVRSEANTTNMDSFFSGIDYRTFTEGRINTRYTTARVNNGGTLYFDVIDPAPINNTPPEEEQNLEI